MITSTGTFAKCVGGLSGEFSGAHLPYITTPRGSVPDARRIFTKT
ncbi:MAG: hypothetical protein JWQ91_1063 [Aeromicrobium sp.]|nr:hypothetical protein [Aeromicrobium sp.]MCW2824146.1 hypothetical protein [Aeromicrobium sp.]